jgi:hypothetical protein
MNRRILYLAAGVILSASLAMGLALVNLHTSGSADSANSNSASSAKSQTAAPTTSPSGDSPLPPEFAILQTHNPFGHGAPRAGALIPGSEAALVFRGVVQDGPGFFAFIEDMAAKHVSQVAIGDRVARGQILSIDIDAIHYQVDGDSRRIAVGQNLMGEQAPPIPTSRPAPPATPQPGPPGPQRPGMPPMPGGPPVQIMEEPR